MSSRAKEKERRRRQRLAAERVAEEDRAKRRQVRLVLGGVLAAVVVAAVAVAVASSGSGSGSSSAYSASVSQAELRSLPSPLAENVSRSNQIIDEGVPALEDRLSALQGFPVVVNQWASWCPPCRAEIPLFQQAAQEFRKDVAFLGVDMQDERGAAEDFLDELPMPYPSIWDPDASAISSLGGGQVSPTTALVDARGEVAFTRQGQYSSLPEIEADIERYLVKRLTRA